MTAEFDSIQQSHRVDSNPWHLASGERRIRFVTNHVLVIYHWSFSLPEDGWKTKTRL